MNAIEYSYLRFQVWPSPRQLSIPPQISHFPVQIVS